MSHTSAHARPPRCTARLTVAAALCAAALALTSAPAHAAAAVDEAFTSTSADRFEVLDGQWTVIDGAYRATAAGAAPALSLHRTAVRGDVDWRASARITVDDVRGTAGLVFNHVARDRFLSVRLGAAPGGSGVYATDGARSTRLAAIDIVAEPGTAYVVELRSDGTRVKVYVAPAGAAPVYRSKVSSTAPVMRLGLVTSTGAAFDDLHVAAVPAEATTAPGPAPSPQPEPAPEPTPAPPEAPAPTDPAPVSTVPPVAGHGARNVAVSTSGELAAALADAMPGDVITIADGIYTSKGLRAPLVVGGKQYTGTFVLARSGTPTAPIVIQGSPRAVIDGKPGKVGTGTQYGLYLAAADHVRVTGITVRNVSKGVVLDESDFSTISGLTVTETGQEAIHLRAFSSDNVVEGNRVSHTGLKNETYGEGIYVGSANSNWGTYSGGRPDASDRNHVIGNHISSTSAESMDIKEGTTGGIIRGNVMDGAGMTGSWADSWIDLKGNGWVVEGNHGVNGLADGFQVHGALPGWGNDNLFRENVADVRSSGYGFWLQNNVTGNVVSCDNVVVAAASGFANTTCRAG